MVDDMNKILLSFYKINKVLLQNSLLTVLKKIRHFNV